MTGQATVGRASYLPGKWPMGPRLLFPAPSTCLSMCPISAGLGMVFVEKWAKFGGEVKNTNPVLWVKRGWSFWGHFFLQTVQTSVQKVRNQIGI